MNLWSGTLKELEKRINPNSYDKWFSSTVVLYEDDFRIIILVPSALTAKRFTDTYAAAIQFAFGSLGKPLMKLYCIHQEPEKQVSLLQASTDNPSLR
jgi:chromosomal replication initiation ATPase DnaA